MSSIGQRLRNEISTLSTELANKTYGEYGNEELVKKVESIFNQLKGIKEISIDENTSINKLIGHLFDIGGKTYWSNPTVEKIFKSIFRPEQIKIEKIQADMDAQIRAISLLKVNTPTSMPKKAENLQKRNINSSIQKHNTFAIKLVYDYLKTHAELPTTIPNAKTYLSSVIDQAIKNPPVHNTVLVNALVCMEQKELLSIIEKEISPLPNRDTILTTLLDKKMGLADDKRPFSDDDCVAIAQNIKDTNKQYEYLIYNQTRFLSESQPKQTATRFEKIDALLDRIEDSKFKEDMSTKINNLKKTYLPQQSQTASPPPSNTSKTQEPSSSTLETFLEQKPLPESFSENKQIIENFMKTIAKMDAEEVFNLIDQIKKNTSLKKEERQWLFLCIADRNTGWNKNTLTHDTKEKLLLAILESQDKPQELTRSNVLRFTKQLHPDKQTNDQKRQLHPDKQTNNDPNAQWKTAAYTNLYNSYKFPEA